MIRETPEQYFQTNGGNGEPWKSLFIFMAGGLFVIVLVLAVKGLSK